MEMKISFEGAKKVIAHYNGKKICTDQPIQGGGNDSAPAPFDLFLASIGTCAGIYIKSFCDQRGIDASKLEITQGFSFDRAKGLIDEINVNITFPSDFPEKYKEPLKQTASLCAVKKHLHDPPKINVK